MNTLRFLFPATVALLVAASAAAQSPTSSCPGKNILLQLKNAIDSPHLHPPGEGGYRFPVYRIVEEAACVSQGMDTTLRRQRVALMWQQLASEPASTDSSLRLRDVLRYAIRQRYQPLMLAAVNRWGLDLNERAETGQSLLMYLEEQIATEPDSTTVRMLQEYEDIYTSAGAGHPQHLSFMISILTRRFDAVKRYGYGLYAVQKGGKWGWVNHKGELVIPLQYKAVRHYLPDLFEVSKDGVHYYYVDRRNKRTKGPWQ